MDALVGGLSLMSHLRKWCLQLNALLSVQQRASEVGCCVFHMHCFCPCVSFATMCESSRSSGGVRGGHFYTLLAAPQAILQRTRRQHSQLCSIPINLSAATLCRLVLSLHSEALNLLKALISPLVRTNTLKWKVSPPLWKRLLNPLCELLCTTTSSEMLLLWGGSGEPGSQLFCCVSDPLYLA